MGQYYIGVNLTKKEFLYPLDFRTGLKLMESSYVGNKFTDALAWLVENDWHGDRVALVGDYAWEDFTSEMGQEAYEKLQTCDSDPFLLKQDPEARNAGTRFSTYGPHPNEWNRAEIAGATREIVAPTLRFVYNETKGVYLDRREAPVAWSYVDEADKSLHFVRIDPLAMYLAIGNGLGGGDYHNRPGYDFVGSWAFDVVGATDIEPEGLEKIECPFDENGVFLTATDGEILAAVDVEKLSSDYPSSAELMRFLDLEAEAA